VWSSPDRDNEAMRNGSGGTGSDGESGVIPGLRLSGLPPLGPEVDGDELVESMPTGMAEAERMTAREPGEYSTIGPLAEIAGMREISHSAATNPRVAWRARIVALAVLLPILVSFYFAIRSVLG
jgi:hypothetical protein